MGSLTPELSLSVGLIFSQRQLSKVQARRWPQPFLKSLPTQRDDPKHNLKLHVFPVLQETLLGVLLHEGRTGFSFRPQPPGAVVCPSLWLLFSQAWRWLLAASLEPPLSCPPVVVGEIRHPVSVQFAWVISLVQSVLSLCKPEQPLWSQRCHRVMLGGGGAPEGCTPTGWSHLWWIYKDRHTLSQHLSFSSQVTQGYV